MKLQKGKLALVTGASSGIGMSFAHALAAKGLDLVLVARSSDKLKELAGQLSKEHGVRVETLTADLSRPGSAKEVWDAAVKNGWSVDLLINNAGFGKWGEFLDFSLETYGEMMRLNMLTLVELCHLFLPSLLKKPGLGIINVGSTGSLVPVPFAGVYGATKAFVLSFTDALYGEYASRGVHFMTLCPGGTATGFAEVANAEAARRRGPFGASPDVVAADAVKAFEKGKIYVVTTKDNYFNTAFMPRLLPRRVMANLVAAVFRRVAGK